MHRCKRIVTATEGAGERCFTNIQEVYSEGHTYHKEARGEDLFDGFAYYTLPTTWQANKFCEPIPIHLPLRKKKIKLAYRIEKSAPVETRFQMKKKKLLVYKNFLMKTGEKKTLKNLILLF